MINSVNLQQWTCEGFGLMSLLVIFLSFEYLSGHKELTEPISCPASLETLEHVPSCPKDKDTWEERSRKKQCSMIQQNCTNSSIFVYHCLPIHIYRNGTVEVCAPATSITGYSCAEYNTGGLIIQPSPTKKCKKCDFVHSSRFEYAYQECYANLSTSADLPMATDATKNETDKGNAELQVTPVPIVIFGIIIPVGVSIALAVIIFLYRGQANTGRAKKEKMEFSKLNGKNEKPEEQSVIGNGQQEFKPFLNET